MANGIAFLLKLGNGETPLGYETVAGLRASSVAINSDIVVKTHKQETWREILSGAGVRSVSVSATGIMLGTEAETSIRTHALAGTIDDYELSFEDGQRLRGRFLIQRLDYAGVYNGERNYTLQIESSGPVEAI